MQPGRELRPTVISPVPASTTKTSSTSERTYVPMDCEQTRRRVDQCNNLEGTPPFKALDDASTPTQMKRRGLLFCMFLPRAAGTSQQGSIDIYMYL